MTLPDSDEQQSMKRSKLETSMIDTVKTGNIPSVIDRVSAKDDKSLIMYVLVQKATWSVTGRKSVNWDTVRRYIGWTLKTDTLIKRYNRMLDKLADG